MLNLKNVIADLGKGQRMTTKIIRELEHPSYEEMPKNLGLFSLEKKTENGICDRGVLDCVWGRQSG